jgi:DNA-binding LytR/AlgR family response regulator
LLDEIYNIFDEIMKCLIVDDDPLICDLLEHFCSKINEVSSITTSTSGFEAINLINTSIFDVIFLDYNLPDLTGQDILEVIDKNTAVVMITSNKDFASESYNYDQIVDFLVKPIDFTRFFRGFQKAQTYAAGKDKKDSRLFIKDGNKLVKIDLGDVCYFPSRRRAGSGAAQRAHDDRDPHHRRRRSNNTSMM